MRIAAPRKERGIAMVLVLAVTALLVALVVEGMAQARLGLRREENARDYTRAYYLAWAGIEAAGLLLARDRAESSIDHLQERWAQPLGPYPVGDGEVSVSIVSADGRLNLNDLIGRDGKLDEEFAAILRRLYERLGLQPELVDALVDWIDPDEVPTGSAGAESDYYSALPHPYRSKNTWLDSLQELPAVRGYDEKVLERLRPYVSALPPPTLLNVNTAPPEVLAALDPALSEAEVNAIVTVRSATPFATVDNLLALPVLQKYSLPKKWLTTVSRYFYVSSRARLGRFTYTLDQLLDRGAQPMRLLGSG